MVAETETATVANANNNIADDDKDEQQTIGGGGIRKIFYSN